MEIKQIKEFFMAKKKKSMGLLYFIGMILVVVGFFLPMFKAGPIEPNGLDFLDFDNFGFVTIGGLLIIVGAALGAALNFLSVKNKKTLQLVALIVSIAGGVVLFIGFNDNTIYRAIAKGFLKHAYIGFYVVLAGWVAALVGYITGK